MEMCTLEELGVSKCCARTQQDFIRLDTLELLLRGYSRQEVVSIKAMSARTLRSWVQRFNARGIDGVITKASPGRPRKLEKTLFHRVAREQLENGECPSVVQLHGYLTRTLSEELSYSTCLRYTHEAGYSLIVPRKINPKADPEAQEQFIKEFNAQLSRKPLRVFFCDEVGFEGDPRPCRQWFQKGTKPRVKNDGLHVRHSVIGAVAPQDGELFSLVVPYTDTQVFQLFLDSLAKNLGKEQVYLVLDNASWHHATALKWHSIIPVYLPPYSPELNPIEQLWRVVKDRFFKNWYSRDENDLVDRICEGLLALHADRNDINSICAVHYLS